MSIPPIQLLKNTLNVQFYTGADQAVNIKSSTHLVKTRARAPEGAAMVSFFRPDKQARAIYLRGIPFKPQYSLSSNQYNWPSMLFELQRKSATTSLLCEIGTIVLRTHINAAFMNES